MLKRFLIPLVILAAAVVITMALVRARPEVQKTPAAILPPTVRVMQVAAETVALQVTSQGTVMPETEADLVSEVSGSIVWVSPSFDEGGYFAKGAALLRLDPRDYELNVASAKAQVAQAQVALAREEAEAAVARQEWQDLGDGEAPPLVARKPQLDEAKARLAAAEATLAKADLDLSRTTIQAPFSGRLRRKNVDLGEFVNRGTPLATIYSVNNAEVQLPVADSELEFLDLRIGSQLGDKGPAVTLTADFGGKLRTWKGKIVRTGGEIDPTTRMVPLIAQVSNPYSASDGTVPMSVGLFVEATIDGTTAEGVFRVPRSAVHNGDELHIIDGDDKLRIRKIDILRATEDDVYVAAGLDEQERVCLTRLDTVIDGMSVTPKLEQPSNPAEIEVALESAGNATL
jgi:RND family efflux transporter MFP subunit